MYEWSINISKLQRAMKDTNSQDENVVMARYIELGGKVDKTKIKLPQEVLETKPLPDAEVKRKGRPKKVTTDPEV